MKFVGDFQNLTDDSYLSVHFKRSFIVMDSFFSEILYWHELRNTPNETSDQ